jgi:hypothetical protein
MDDLGRRQDLVPLGAYRLALRVIELEDEVGRLRGELADGPRWEDMADWRRFEGTCDVCGDPISLDYNFRKHGVIDVAFTDDGTVYTWIRHFATAPADANPDCAVYSSRVYEVEHPDRDFPAVRATLLDDA